MLNRFVFGLCLIALVAFIFQEMGKAPSVTPYFLVGAPHAHEKALDGRGVAVAVLDEGFDSSHAFLKDKFSSLHRYNTAHKNSQDISETLVFENGAYTFESHGTHVSGIILHLAPEAEIIPIKIEGAGGDQTFVKALQHAANSPAHIVNISMRLSYTGREISPNVRTALFQLAQVGKLIVIAAGNDSAGLTEHPYTASLVELSHHPLMKGRLLLVGASSYKNGTESLAEFSNFPGQNAFAMPQTYFITAPGDQIKSSVTGGLFAEKSGTSMAAPMVVGAAALLKQAYPHLSSENIAQLLLKSARKIALDGKTLPHSQFGAGILNLKGALEFK
ncbi:MAG: S8 family serine peptidase [Alphaproteobacteria bacterium]|nr:S8 family serine peptidase [Alphaproteobacteria bacterium]